jgi:putative salt-induced outer membrane protein YdiY
MSQAQVPGLAVAAAFLFALLAPASGLQAQEEPAKTWSDVAELTFVMTAGNASSSTFGLKNTLERAWGASSFKISAGAVRTESGTTTRTAVGTPDNFTVNETTETELTAENYFLKSRFDRTLGEAAFLYGGADWDRNTFAGIQNRYGFVGGVGRAFLDEDASELKADVGLTYTIQDDVVEKPDADDGFLGLRGSYDYSRELSETTDLTSVLVVDQNLSTADDTRADWTNSLAVAMSDRLALKTSLQILYDRDPALTAIPLGDTEVLAPLDEVDTVFTVALVVNF